MISFHQISPPGNPPREKLDKIDVASHVLLKDDEWMPYSMINVVSQATQKVLTEFLSQVNSLQEKFLGRDLYIHIRTPLNIQIEGPPPARGILVVITFDIYSTTEDGS